MTKFESIGMQKGDTFMVFMLVEWCCQVDLLSKREDSRIYLFFIF